VIALSIKNIFVTTITIAMDMVNIVYIDFKVKLFNSMKYMSFKLFIHKVLFFNFNYAILF
jgi:hypothetical protein